MQDPVHITSFHIQKINLRGGSGEKNIQQFFLNIKLAENVNRKYLINSTKAVLSFRFKLFPEYLELQAFTQCKVLGPQIHLLSTNHHYRVCHIPFLKI